MGSIFVTHSKSVKTMVTTLTDKQLKTGYTAIKNGSTDKILNYLKSIGVEAPVTKSGGINKNYLSKELKNLFELVELIENENIIDPNACLGMIINGTGYKTEFDKTKSGKKGDRKLIGLSYIN